MVLDCVVTAGQLKHQKPSSLVVILFFFLVLDLERLENMFSTFKKNQNCLKTRLLLHLSSFPPALCGTSLFPKYPFDLTCLPFWSWNVAKDKAVNSWWSSDRDRYESKGPEYTLENHPKKKTSIQPFYYEHIDYWYWHTLISCMWRCRSICAYHF